MQSPGKEIHIFDFLDYKVFLRASIDAMPKAGRGAVKQIAEALRVHPSFVSQILNGDKDFSVEQAGELAAFLSLKPSETEFLLCLVAIERAGTRKLKGFLETKRDDMVKSAQRLKAQFAESKQLDDAARSKFYSSWHYSAVHLLTDIPAFQSSKAIAEFLKLPLDRVEEAVVFLISIGLVENDNGKLACGPSWIFEPAESPNAARHHVNWRLKGLDRITTTDRSRNMFFTMPVTISHADHAKLQQLIRDFVKNLKQTVEPSKPQQLSVITIDLFDLA